MPKLIVQDEARPSNLPTASPTAFGAGVGTAMRQTGVVAQALGEVMNEYAKRDARVKAVQYEAELSAEAQRISLDPDIAGRESQFDDAAKRIREKYRPKYFTGSTFDERAGLATQDLRTKFSHKNTLDAIAEGRRGAVLEADHYGIKAAGAETDEEAASYFAQIAETFDDAHLFLTENERTIAKRDALGTSLKLMAKSNPGMAERFKERLKDVLEPEDVAALEVSIQTESTEIASQEGADSIIDRYGLDASMDELMKAARREFKGEVRSAVEARLATAKRYHDSSKAEAESYARDKYFGQVNAYFEPGSQSRLKPEELPTARRQLRLQMDAEGVPATIQDSILNEFDALASGTAKTDIDLDAYSDLLENPEKIGTPGYMPNELQAMFGKEKATKLTELSVAIGQGKIPNRQVINATISDAFDEEGMGSTQHREERAAIRQQVLAEIAARGGVVEPVEALTITRALIKAAKDRTWFGGADPVGAQSKEIDTAANADPELFRLAVWRASRGGSHAPTREEIAATVRSIQRAVAEFERTHSAEEVGLFLAEQRERGNAGALLLRRSGLVDDDTLMADLPAFKRWVEAQESSGGASGSR